jgi:3,4-dihydroxy 2-butanone 4-phosphate synthase/GTP cyclohydrolase II
VDLARLAGLTPAGVICEIMKDDGEMARMPDLEVFAKKHDLRVVTIADLIQYRLQTERLVRRVTEKKLVLDATGTEWTAYVYEVATDKRDLMPPSADINGLRRSGGAAGTPQMLALVKGTPHESTPILCRMHTSSTIADVFSSTRRDGGKNLREAIARIESAGSGIVVYLPGRASWADELLHHADDQATPPGAPAAGGTLREFGLGAQVLADLGAKQLRLLTNNPRKIAGIRGYGLDVVESVPLAVS